MDDESIDESVGLDEGEMMVCFIHAICVDLALYLTDLSSYLSDSVLFGSEGEEDRPSGLSTALLLGALCSDPGVWLNPDRSFDLHYVSDFEVCVAVCHDSPCRWSQYEDLVLRHTQSRDHAGVVVQVRFTSGVCVSELVAQRSHGRHVVGLGWEAFSLEIKID